MNPFNFFFLYLHDSFGLVFQYKRGNQHFWTISRHSYTLLNTSQLVHDFLSMDHLLAIVKAKPEIEIDESKLRKMIAQMAIWDFLVYRILITQSYL